MPIRIADKLPANEILRKENIFVMDESRAFVQDIRPLKIGILNLMPNKQVTEVQLLRLLSNSPLQLDITLLHMESHNSKNTSKEYLTAFYKVFEDVKYDKFDGFIVTGAPIEHLPFEDVTYWKELCEIMEWTKKNVYSTLHICWGAQAALNYHYNLPKYPLAKKISGVFSHYKSVLSNNSINDKLIRGFDETFYVPHSRYTEILASDINKISDLELLSCSDESGVYLIANKDGSMIFATGHSEYDQNTLKDEYERDINKGDKIEIPKHYFESDDPALQPIVRWRAHSNLLFLNWLNYYVYQETPFDLTDL